MSRSVTTTVMTGTRVAPVFLHHGTHDDIVPFFCAQMAYEAMRKKGAAVTFYPYLRQDHYQPVNTYVIRSLADFARTSIAHGETPAPRQPRTRPTSSGCRAVRSTSGSSEMEKAPASDPYHGPFTSSRRTAT